VELKDAHELERLAGNEHHQGACLQIRALGPLGEGALDDLLDKIPAPPLLLVLDGVQDPHNLGACLRSAGAAETLPLIQVVNLARTLRWLKEREIWVVGADDQAPKSLFETQLTGPLALVLGAEGAGLRRLTRENCDLLVGIPMAGTVESLNVSVAAGVLLFEAARQRRRAPP
jgi:23S rRNA (guanosine2251-2'-O)-methyltransferase